MSVTETDLETTEMRLEVAIALLGLLHHELEDFDDRRAVINDMVECWRALEPQARVEYDERDSSFSALERFAGDYVERVEEGEPADRGKDYDASQHAVWQNHARRLRRRRVSDSPALDSPA